MERTCSFMVYAPVLWLLAVSLLVVAGISC